MRPLDWVVFCLALTYIVLYGLWRARGQQSVRNFVLAGRRVPWYAVGLSVMATQASAVTFISTTGQAYVDGMRFVQFYFGLPIAMGILAYTAVPLFRAANVLTALHHAARALNGLTVPTVVAVPGAAIDVERRDVTDPGARNRLAVLVGETIDLAWRLRRPAAIPVEPWDTAAANGED